MNISATASRWAPTMLSVLRIMSGALFLAHGTAKFLKFPPGTPFEKVAPLSMSGVAGMLELACGALLVAGLFTRPAAFLASGLMAVAYFYAHAGRNVFPILNGGELAIMFCFVFLYIFAAGPGPLSIDAMRRRA